MIVLFWFESIARFINANTSYFNTHRLESKGNFPETFKSQQEKIKMLFTGLGWPILGEMSTALSLWPRVVLKTQHTVSPNMDLPAGE